jgi:hypothetical protein
MVKQLKLGFTRSKRSNRQLRILGRAHSKEIREQYSGAEKTKIRKFYKDLTSLLSGDLSKLKNLTKQNYSFSDNEINYIFQKMKDEQLFLKINTEAGGLNLIPMQNDNTTEKLREFFKYYFDIQEAETEGSDQLSKYMKDKILNMEAVKIEANKKVKNKNGSSFKHYNMTNLNLLKYQIEKKDEEFEDSEEQCLIYALKMAGIEDTKLEDLKLALHTGAHIAKNKIKEISDFIECNINLHFYKKGDKIEIAKYGKYEQSVDIAIYAEHYFIFEETIYNKFCINNYEKCKDYENMNDIYRIKNNDKPQYKPTKKINSLQLIKILNDNKLFSEEIKHEKQNINDYEIDIKNINFNKYNITNQEPSKIKENKENNNYYYFADTETMTNNGTKQNHDLLLVAYTSLINDDVFIYDIINHNNPIEQFLNAICEQTFNGKYPANNDIINIYFHNLKYDFNIIKNYLNIESICEKDNNIYFVNIVYRYKNRKVKIVLKDSFKIINIPLKKFNNTFGLPEKLNKKEAIAYNYYDKKTIYNKECNIDEYKKYLNQQEKETFDEALKSKIKLFNVNIENNTFNPMQYYKYYLKYDCLVLKYGLEKLRDSLLKICNIDCFEEYTISSFSNRYFSENGCFEDVYECKGVLREFLSKAVRGGRVAVLESEKKKLINRELVDYDACSLYPSAIHRICNEFGFPKGEAKQIKTKNINELNNYDYYVVSVKITKINKKQQIPFIDMKDENGILNYVNEVPKDGLYTVIDKITLEDYIKFHKIEYEILDGVYYNEGFNNTFGEYIEKLYNDRKTYKKLKKSNNKQEATEGDVMQNLIKLILNSTYGKTIIKKSKSKTIIKPIDERFNNYIVNNFNTIHDITYINNRQVKIKQNNLDKTSNLSIIGLMVLSMSKRIMNEVMGLANDLNIKVYYQDTDSMHIEKSQIKKLEDEYYKQYNKVLNGSNLGNFHSDFDLDGAYEEVYSTESIFLGKKSYIDHLISKDKEGKTIEGWHIRLKGITKEGIQHAKEKYNNALELFKELSKGKEIEFVLNPYDKPSFDFTENGVYTRIKGEFKRKVKF